MYKLLLGSLLGILLYGCGFHLNGYSGNYKFPFKSTYIQCDGVVICSNFTNAIKTQSLTTLTNKAESAEVTIKLFNEQTSRDPLGFSSTGRIASYLLTYQAQAQVIQKGVPISDDINVSAQQTMQYNDSTILSANQQEASIWDQLHQNATNQLVRRLVHFKPKSEDVDESK